MCACVYVCRCVIHTFFLTKYNSITVTAARARSRTKLLTFSTIRLLLSLFRAPKNSNKGQFVMTKTQFNFMIFTWNQSQYLWRPGVMVGGILSIEFGTRSQLSLSGRTLNCVHPPDVCSESSWLSSHRRRQSLCERNLGSLSRKSLFHSCYETKSRELKKSEAKCVCVYTALTVSIPVIGQRTRHPGIIRRHKTCSLKGEGIIDVVNPEFEFWCVWNKVSG